MKLTVNIDLTNVAFWHEDGRLNVEEIGRCFRAVEQRVGTMRDGVLHNADLNLLGTFHVTGQKPKQ
jgi:hypothetical protein